MEDKLNCIKIFLGLTCMQIFVVLNKPENSNQVTELKLIAKEQ